MLRPIKTLLLFVLLFSYTLIAYGQDNPRNTFGPDTIDRPRLVVGIVVDQMRYEYITRFWSAYGNGGFKRLVNNGFSFTNHHYNYFPTYTGPGHAAIYTGTTPSVNGIVGNSWYDRQSQSGMYVVSDSTVQMVGGEGESGKMSPRNLLSTTVTDELKRAIPKSKVVSVSIKDRGAILPAGHLADGAYWYNDETGHFITSTWYADKLPEWVESFNDRGLAEEYSKKTWSLLYEMEKYKQSNKDNSPYEGTFGDHESPVFPHSMNGSLSRIQTSPYGNSLVAEIAKAAVEGQSLGADAVTDFLAVSFSSTDYVGHKFGPNSVELQDTYLRLDREIADLLTYFDQKVGKGNYVVFLTADHAAVDVPASLNDRGLPGGYFNSEEALDALQAHLQDTYGEGEWIEAYANQQVYLNRKKIKQQDLSLKTVQQEVARFLRQFDGVASTSTAHNFQTEGYSTGLQAMYQRGYYAKRSGDVYIQLAPGWLDSSSKVGTSHGSPYAYDTHVPLIFYGWNIPQGATGRKTVIPQIAPTISNMLQIKMPSGSKSIVLQFE